ncbi:MAG: type III pantothenate kinase [Candidatus Omnitrophica bacterium]|nr:type III pantothenate kinase [Candidatus Omnitrophota bacterium]
MLLSKSFIAMDIGNNSIDNAVFNNGRLVSRFNVYASNIPIYSKYLGFSGKESYKIAIICSVVPELSKKVSFVLKKSGIESLKLGDIGFRPLIKGCYKGLGEDREVGLWSAKQSYKCPLTVIDAGTAITIDVAKSDGSYGGGIIIPGIKMWSESLTQGTALLPEVIWKARKKDRSPLLGKSTKQCILAGIEHSLIGMIDATLDNIRRYLVKKPFVVLTGGDCHRVSRFLRHKHIVDDMLILRGLRDLYYRSQKRREA